MDSEIAFLANALGITEAQIQVEIAAHRAKVRRHNARAEVRNAAVAKNAVGKRNRKENAMFYSVVRGLAVGLWFALGVAAVVYFN